MHLCPPSRKRSWRTQSPRSLPMESLEIELLDEPTLEFRYGQRLPDPKSGLSIFGAYDMDAVSWPGQVPYAIVGTPNGIAAFARFAEHLTNPAVSPLYTDPT